VLASLEIGESSRSTVRACLSAKRTFAALIELFAPLAAGLPPLPPPPVVAQAIAPALLRAFGHVDGTLGASSGAFADAAHSDLPVDATGYESTMLTWPLVDAYPAEGAGAPLPFGAAADDDTLIDLG
jgi:hypothetical protein